MLNKGKVRKSTQQHGTSKSAELLSLEAIHTYNHLKPFIDSSIRKVKPLVSSIEGDFRNEAFIEILLIQKVFIDNPDKYSPDGYLVYVKKTINNRFIDLCFDEYSGLIRVPRLSKEKLLNQTSLGERVAFTYKNDDIESDLIDDKFEESITTHLCAMKIVKELTAYSMFFEGNTLNLALDKIINNKSYSDIADELGITILKASYHSRKTISLLRELLSDIGYEATDFK